MTPRQEITYGQVWMTLRRKEGWTKGDQWRTNNAARAFDAQTQKIKAAVLKAVRGNRMTTQEVADAAGMDADRTRHHLVSLAQDGLIRKWRDPDRSRISLWGKL